MEYQVVAMAAIQIYMFVLQLFGVLYVFNVINSRTDIPESNKFLGRILAVFIGFTVPVFAIIVGCYAAAEFTTILQEKRRKRREGKK